jgi:hypothetical protein
MTDKIININKSSCIYDITKNIISEWATNESRTKCALQNAFITGCEKTEMV